MLCVSDSMSMVRLQDQVREARRLLDKERSTRASMENKRKNLEKEKMEVIMWVGTEVPWITFNIYLL